jgi:hypothetical protein
VEEGSKSTREVYQLEEGDEDTYSVPVKGVGSVVLGIETWKLDGLTRH